MEQTRPQLNIYFDMDGVPAIYGQADSVEDMSRPGYFLNRPAQQNVIDLIRVLKQDPQFHVEILSAVFSDNHSAKEKEDWLTEHGLSDVKANFVPCNTNKGDFVDRDGVNFLVDDYSKNLFAWEQCGPNFFGIKFNNGINGNHGTWREHGGFTIDYASTVEELYQAISMMGILVKADAFV